LLLFAYRVDGRFVDCLRVQFIYARNRLLLSVVFGLIAMSIRDRALWDRKKPHARQAFWRAKRGAKPDALPVHPWSRLSWLMMRRCVA